MDQFKHTQSDNRFAIPLIRTRGKEGSPNILINPGGPGQRGVNYLRHTAREFTESVGPDFHLLSFDPRGVGGSLPTMNLSISEQTCRLSKMNVPKGIRQSNDLETGLAKEYAKDWARAASMEQRMAYVNTPQTAADMNSILKAVGQQDMLYWGLSYGTALGQTYASLYPQKVQRMIIDGVTDNVQHYSNGTLIEKFEDTDRVFDAFLNECIQADSDCALSSVANSKESLQVKLHDFGESFDQNPMEVFATRQGCAKFGYMDFWEALAQHIASAMAGNLTGLYSAAGVDTLLTTTHLCSVPIKAYCSSNDESIALVNANDALTGAEHWPQEKEAMIDKLLQGANLSSFAQFKDDICYVKQRWKIPRTHYFSQPAKVDTQHPLLILSTSFDPVCPLKAAKTANTIFERSRLIELEGFGHTTSSLPSKCVAEWIQSYLSNGTLPEENVKCQVGSGYSYFPELDEHGAPRRLSTFANPEDEKVYLAQLRLANKLFQSSQRLRVW